MENNYLCKMPGKYSFNVFLSCALLKRFFLIYSYPIRTIKITTINSH